MLRCIDRYWMACQADYQSTPESVVADGGYASHDNVRQAHQRGVKRAVFNKPSGLGLHENAYV